MPHLVKPIVLESSRPMSVGQCLAMVQAAHGYLVDSAIAALQQTNVMKKHLYWGTQVKRLRVTFSNTNRPALIDSNLTEHNLIEIYNQCATMERLIDALIWINECLPEYQVVRCHPTTSSIQQNPADSIPDNDIVLVNDEGQFARFEVSDVIGQGDSNLKEVKDLMSLGVLGAKSGDQKYVTKTWISERLFVVTSQELANKIRKHLNGLPKEKPTFRYEEVKSEGLTRIFEVLPATI